MASQATTNQKILDDELKKPLPDKDIVYYLQNGKDYWNTIDTEKLDRGYNKLRQTKGAK